MGKKEKEKKEKPLDKMTAKELREICVTTGEVVGVHGMNKAELIAAIKEVRGIVEEKSKKTNRYPCAEGKNQGAQRQAGTSRRNR